MADKNTRKGNLQIVEPENTEDETVRTFVMFNEDHTLGNVLRHVVMKNPAVQFCGYSVPHPSENKINFRIQTNGPPATEVLQEGLKDLNMLCEHILNTFQNSVNTYKGHEQYNMDTD